MKFRLQSVAAAAVIAVAPFSMAFATTAVPAATASSAATPVPAAAAAAAPVPLQSPVDWISSEDTTFTPVVDEVSRRMLSAARAFDAKDNAKASAELNAVADSLKGQLGEMSHTKGAGHAQGAKRLTAAIAKIHKAAEDIAQGKVHTRAEFDGAFNAAFLSDLDSRWLETDTVTWYPVSEEPQRHFRAAATAYAKKDYATAATEIHKATGFVRLEASRTDGDAHRQLERSAHDLDVLAASVAKGTATDTHAMEHTFARADSALALSHRAKATASWTAKHYDAAGYELKAAAHGLESAAAWTGDTAKDGVVDVVAQTRTLGDKLASGADTTGVEVRKGFALFDHGFDKLAHALGASTGAAPKPEAAASAGSAGSAK